MKQNSPFLKSFIIINGHGEIPDYVLDQHAQRVPHLMAKGLEVYQEHQSFDIIFEKNFVQPDQCFTGDCYHFLLFT